MAVAMDEAFCFYYQENLDFLRRHGWELVPFSPLHDAALPDQIEAILLGGGYPELYAKELSSNEPMLASIRNAHASGIKILAECGGFLYLQEHLEDEHGNQWPMAGLIHADGFRTAKLGRFGYISLEQGGACRIKGHEFHYWDSTAPGTAFHAAKPQSNRGWDCMYQTDSLLAGFPHLYYLSARADFKLLIRYCHRGRDNSMMHLVTGASASGKSAYAEDLLADAMSVNKYYIATMRPWGTEGGSAGEKHRAMREGKGFQTIGSLSHAGCLKTAAVWKPYAGMHVQSSGKRAV